MSLPCYRIMSLKRLTMNKRFLMCVVILLCTIPFLTILSAKNFKPKGNFQSKYVDSYVSNKIEINNNPDDSVFITDERKSLNIVRLQKKVVIIDSKKKNILTQDMFCKWENGERVPNINTLFIIKHDYDLNGESIKIPQNCLLQFEGGSLKNGTVIGNYCSYMGKGFGLNLIYKDFVKIDNGTIVVDELTNINTVDNIDQRDNYNLANIINYAIKKCVDKYGYARLVFDGKKTYGFKSPIFLLDNVTIDGNGCKIVFPTNKSDIYSMDGVQAFLTNRIHASIDGNINNYSTTILGSSNIVIKNIVFANVDDMKNFGFNVNCERGFIAMCNADHVQIDGIVAEKINTAHCAIWCNDMKNFEVKNCTISQNVAFNSNGVGGIWSSGAEYMYNVYIHHNNFAIYGDESISIEMKKCDGTNHITITNNTIKGSLLATIHNFDKRNPISSLDYSNNQLDDVTGIVDAKYQGNPRLLMLNGDVDSISYDNNVISTDTETNIISFYNPCKIKVLRIIGNIVKGNLGIIDNNSAYVESCIVERNNHLSYMFKPNFSELKNTFIRNNKFLLSGDISFYGGGKHTNIVLENNVFESSDDRVRKCHFGSNDGRFRIANNTFVSSEIIHTNASSEMDFIVIDNKFLK